MQNTPPVDKSAQPKPFLIDIRNSLIQWLAAKELSYQDIGTIMNMHKTSVHRIVKLKKVDIRLWIKF